MSASTTGWMRGAISTLKLAHHGDSIILHRYCRSRARAYKTIDNIWIESLGCTVIHPGITKSGHHVSLLKKLSNASPQLIPKPQSSSLHRALSLHASEHYTNFNISVLPTSSENTIALLLAANKYSPSNFWSGRFRCVYTYDSSSQKLLGNIRVDVHYYEDGNVRLTTSKQVPETKVNGGKAGDVVREIAKVEKKYHEGLNRGFMELNEGGFKGLRRPLPVTRQKMEWGKIKGYRAGRDIGGGRR